MYRLSCLLILVLMSVGLSAQEMTDSMSVAPVVPSAEDQQLQKGVERAWRRMHRARKQSPLQRTHSFDAWRSADSLRREVMALELPDASDSYLYDMRLPVISTGAVPDTAAYHLDRYMERTDSVEGKPDAMLRGFENHYSDLQMMELERHVSRFKYASGDPRRFRFARRKFDVLTQSSQLIDTRQNLLNTRLVDEKELDLGDATLEDFSQTLVLKADKWHWKGDHTLQMQQTALSDNWYKGGENNMSLSSQQRLVINRYDENDKTTFDMIFDLKLSAYYTAADTIHSTKVSDNVFSLDLKYGYKAWKKWYYSTQLYAKTPVFDQYQSNSSVTKATFFAPLEVNLSVGMDYKYISKDKRLNFSLMLAPLSYNLKYVKDPRVDPVSYGIKEGDNSLHEIGSTITGKLDWKIAKNISWTSRLYCFTSYKSVMAEFENTLSFSISRFFSARIYAYPRFDDSRDHQVQIKEMLTFGFSYQW